MPSGAASVSACQQRLGFPVLAQPLIGRRGLKANVQRDERIVHPLAQGEQTFAAADHLGVSALGKIHLIFDHLDHRSARREDADRGEAVLGKDLRN